MRHLLDTERDGFGVRLRAFMTGQDIGDITKLLGPVKWTYFHLYVILDKISAGTWSAGWSCYASRPHSPSG